MDELIIHYDKCSEFTPIEGFNKLGDFTAILLRSVAKDDPKLVFKNAAKIINLVGKSESNACLTRNFGKGEIRSDFHQVFSLNDEVQSEKLKPFIDKIYELECFSIVDKQFSIVLLKVSVIDTFKFSLFYYELKATEGDTCSRILQKFDFFLESDKIIEFIKTDGQVVSNRQPERSHQLKPLTDNSIYENCKSDTLIGSKRVSSVVHYVLNTIGLSINGPYEDKYKNYVIGLQGKLESAEPYCSQVEIHEKSREIVLEKFKQILPSGMQIRNEIVTI